MSYNRKLETWLKPNPSQTAGINNIQIPGDVEHIIWQTRDHEPTQYELDLVEAIVSAFSSGVEELKPLVDYINEEGVRDPEGRTWTPETFEREMARLGH